MMSFVWFCVSLLSFMSWWFGWTNGRSWNWAKRMNRSVADWLLNRLWRPIGTDRISRQRRHRSPAPYPVPTSFWTVLLRSWITAGPPSLTSNSSSINNNNSSSISSVHRLPIEAVPYQRLTISQHDPFNVPRFELETCFLFLFLFDRIGAAANENQVDAIRAVDINIWCFLLLLLVICSHAEQMASVRSMAHRRKLYNLMLGLLLSLSVCANSLIVLDFHLIFPGNFFFLSLKMEWKNRILNFCQARGGGCVCVCLDERWRRMRRPLTYFVEEGTL